MPKVNVNREELLTILRKNKAQHREVFEEALEGYRVKMINYLEDMLDDVKKGKKVDHYIRLPLPEDQTKEYERAIKMFEMSVDPVVELDDDSFRELVLDQWHWREKFINTNSTYSTKASLLK